MGLALLSASTEYVEGTTPVTESSMPFSAGCWFNPDNTDGQECLISFSDASLTTEQFMLIISGAGGSGAGDDLACVERDSGGAFNPAAVATTPVVSGSWQHALGVWNSTTSRDVYLDGGNTANDTGTGASSGIDKMTLGRLGDNSPNWEFDGSLAEVAVWDAALTAAEAASLATGLSPRLVRPQNLIFYMPLVVTGTYNDHAGGIVFTTVGGTPTSVAHPRVFNPVGQGVIPPPTTERIDGQSVQYLDEKEFMTVVSDGTNWIKF